MFIFDGNPNGRIMCELSNWNGRVYKILRNDISEFAKRSDTLNTGIYFLFGKNDDNNETIYIDEAEEMLTRIRQHLKDANYCNDCIAVISKDNLLNKAHVKYLENKFYIMAQKSGRAVTTNKTIPTCSSLSEYDEAMLEEFISNTKLLVNTLGYKVFDSIEESAIKKDQAQLIFQINATRGAEAKGMIVADGFVVLKNSIIATTITPSMSASLQKLRNKLLESKIIDNNFKFAKNNIFTSPSLAAAIVMGRNANERTEWKTSDHKSIKDFEEEN